MKLGKLEKVELRDLWKGEASDFTPWLAKQENIELLSNCIGIELEVVSQEKSVGPFRADILCRETRKSNYVLIENQLDKTDHNHLGQIITYAAGLDAVNIIWISKEFTEEHRAAIDWLNRISDNNINFFGVVIQAFKIGDSAPAPMFDIVAKPNDWSKSIKNSIESKDLTETDNLKIEYWTGLKNYLENSKSKLKQQKPLPNHWSSFALGKSGYGMDAMINTQKKIIRVGLNISDDIDKSKFNSIKSKCYEKSLSDIGNNLEWDELPGKKSSYAFVTKEADVTNRLDWEEQYKWLKDMLEKFDKFFRPIIKNMN